MSRGLLLALMGLAMGSIGADAAPKGEVTKHTFDRSAIFPGTTRDYWVYIPRQYDPKTPACVYVNQDGVQFRAPEVFDELIEKKAMPVVIGVFVTPGRVKAKSGTALDRFNRSYEYDGLGDAYARFVLEELLPEVETLKAGDGREIKLSKKGNDRAIGGSSSGAVCAWNAAWERPNAFPRVFSSIGTYVGLRGANVFPTLVRKVEPKPLRVFLQDGSKDQNIYGGDWWMANQEMERSLTFAGYEVKHEWGDGGHNGDDATKLFPEAMTWLWKDWPQPVKAGMGSAQLKEILIAGEDWVMVGDGYKFTEGPAVGAGGELYFNDIPNNRAYKVSAEGKVTMFAEGTHAANGMAFGPDERLFAAATGIGAIVAYDQAGKASTIVEGIRGNDLVVGHDGGMYVTEPGGGNEPSKVWYVSAKGEKRVVDMGLRYANGVTLSPDQSLLYVADYRSHWVYSYQVQPEGGLLYKQKYYHLHAPDDADDAGADGIRVDRDGRLYVATRMGIQVCDQAGRVNVIIPTPTGKVSNIAIGDGVLYATCNDRVYSRKVRVKGARADQAPIKPAAPRL